MDSSHNIIQIYNSGLSDWQYFLEYSPHSIECGGISNDISWNIVNPIEQCYAPKATISVTNLDYFARH